MIRLSRLTLLTQIEVAIAKAKYFVPHQTCRSVAEVTKSRFTWFFSLLEFVPHRTSSLAAGSWSAFMTVQTKLLSDATGHTDRPT